MCVSLVDEVIGPLPPCCTPPVTSPPTFLFLLYLLFHFSSLLDIVLALLDPARYRGEGPN
jgi:hypothetical protein